MHNKYNIDVISMQKILYGLDASCEHMMKDHNRAVIITWAFSLEVSPKEIQSLKRGSEIRQHCNTLVSIVVKSDRFPIGLEPRSRSERVCARTRAHLARSARTHSHFNTHANRCVRTPAGRERASGVRSVFVFAFFIQFYPNWSSLDGLI